jgi:hypothetical protein
MTEAIEPVTAAALEPIMNERREILIYLSFGMPVRVYAILTAVMR